MTEPDALSEPAVTEPASGEPAASEQAASEQAASEPAAESDAAPPSSADERAARELQEMQAAIDAERAERAASEASSAAAAEPPAHRLEPLGLSMLTSALSEFRDSGDRLQAFEVNGSRTSFGLLCNALSRMPGVAFPHREANAWFLPPSRFTFRETQYEVRVSHGNLRVIPAELGPAIPEMEEILTYVRANVLKTTKPRFVTAHRME